MVTHMIVDISVNRPLPLLTLLGGGITEGRILRSKQRACRPTLSVLLFVLAHPTPICAQYSPQTTAIMANKHGNLVGCAARSLRSLNSIGLIREQG